MSGRALLVGINQYDSFPALSGCVNDTLSLVQMISHHESGHTNFECRLLLSQEHDGERITFTHLKDELKTLFDYDGRILFYFSGHGYSVGKTTYLVTQDGTASLPGITLATIIAMANESRATEIIIILDSCHSGAIGDTAMQEVNMPPDQLRDGITILAAAKANQEALEVRGQGLFTSLVVGALRGAAKDVRGRVSAAAIYAYVEQALGVWEQRPIYKTSGSRLEPVRYCEPLVDDVDLSQLNKLFATPDIPYQLDRTYEHTEPTRTREHVAIFQILKRYRDAGLLKTTTMPDLYFTAIHNSHVVLTHLGQYYWLLVNIGRIYQRPDSNTRRSQPMPDPEAVARLFHDAYERLAPIYNYSTRRATRKPWEDVPTRNKELMIATAAEVLSLILPPEDLLPKEDTPEVAE